jgi:hypothetical protein
LKQFKEECMTGGLYAEYGTHEQLRADFGQHLAIALNRPQYRWLIRPDDVVEPQDPELNDNEKRLLIAAAFDRSGIVSTGSTIGGFFVEANKTSFVEDHPRSEASWKQVLKRLSTIGYLEWEGDGVYRVTDDGFARADKEIAAAPLEVSLSFAGTPDKQLLSVVANKPITLKKLDFLMSSETCVTGSDLDDTTAVSTTMIPLDHQRIIELFNSPRPDRNHSDHTGPAALRLIFMSSGRRCEVVLPVLLQQEFINNTQWIKLTGSKTFTLT